MKALYGDYYDAYLYDRKIRKEGTKREILIQLSIFRKKEYEPLTVAEALVIELIDQRKMTYSDVAAQLNRNYEVVRTQYRRAKKKTSGLAPPRLLKR